jgi:lipid II:glycine glycyltransferase (peptidoglycan interpeptide bridge formation enzyme)
MLIRPINVDEKDAYNAVVSHPLQSYEWGQFRQKEGQHVERIGMFDNGALVGAFQVSFHHIPHTSYTVGYVPKGMLPDETLLRALTDIGTKRKQSIATKPIFHLFIVVYMKTLTQQRLQKATGNFLMMQN